MDSIKDIIKNAPARQRDIDYIYNGIFVFLPHLARDQKTVQEIESLKENYKDISYDNFLLLLYSFSGEKTIEGAVNKIYEIKNRPEVTETIPVRLQEIVDASAQAPSDYQVSRDEASQKVKASIEKLREIQSQREKTLPPAKTSADFKKTDSKHETVYVEGEAIQRTINLDSEENKELKEIIQLVHKDPKRFKDEAVKRVLENSDPNIPVGPAKAGAEILVNDFISKALDINPTDTEILVDDSPFAVLSGLSKQENAEVLFGNPQQAAAFAQVMKENLDRQIVDSLTAGAILSNALGANVTPVYIPSVSGKTKLTDQVTKSSFASINVDQLIQEINESQATQKQVLNYVRKENPGVYDLLEKKQQILIQEQAKDIADKIVRLKKRFSWSITGGRGFQLPGKRNYSQEQYYIQTTNAQIQNLSFGVSTLNSFPLMLAGSPTGGGFTSSIFNIAAQKAITRLPQVAKLNQMVSGFGAKLATKTAAKLAGSAAANVIPVIGQVVSAITTALAIKDTLVKIGVGIKKWLEKNPWVYGIPILGIGIFIGQPVVSLAGVASMGVLQAGGVGAAAAKALDLIKVLGAMTVASIATPLIIIFVVVPILVAFILFVINSGAYIYPPSSGSGIQSGFTSGGTGIPVICTDEKGEISFDKTTSSNIAERGWEIVRDLYQGFWCFWNRSPGDYPNDVTLYPPSYPELFNENLFEKNPNPSLSEISNCGSCLFWCTYLIQKAYHESGNGSLQATLMSSVMKQDFISRNKFTDSKDATSKNIVPGSVIFFRVESGPARTNHVGLVHHISNGVIYFIQSDAPTKDGTINFLKGGVGVDNLPGIIVEGFGLP